MGAGMQCKRMHACMDACFERHMCIARLHIRRINRGSHAVPHPRAGAPSASSSRRNTVALANPITASWVPSMRVM